MSTLSAIRALLLLHGVALLTTAIVSAFCILAAGSASAEEAWLRAHNLYRCMHNVPALFWSDNLAAQALNTAKMCDCAHCNPQTKGMAENGTCYPPASPKAAVDDWYSEVASYDYNKPEWSGHGHFINVVAKGLTSVGCGCTNNDCFCVYGGYYGSSPAGLKESVLKPIRSQEQCQIGAIDYCRGCQGGQGQWLAQTHDCWRLDGYPLGTAGNPGSDCQICWQSGNVTACGAASPPMGGRWHRIDGSRVTWGGGGFPGYPKDCWRIIGSTGAGERCPGANEPVDIKGIRINGQPPCWVRVDGAGKSVGPPIDCEY